MSLKKTVIRGETFPDDPITYTSDDRFINSTQISASVDPDLYQPIREYDNGMKVMLFPTDDVVDIGDQKWAWKAEKDLVDARVFYRDVTYWFEEIV